MRAALILLVAVSLTAAAGCKNNAADQNVAFGNATTPAEIEALPPDESSATPSNELINGADNADVSDLNAPENAY